MSIQMKEKDTDTHTSQLPIFIDLFAVFVATNEEIITVFHNLMTKVYFTNSVSSHPPLEAALNQNSSDK